MENKPNTGSTDWSWSIFLLKTIQTSKLNGNIPNLTLSSWRVLALTFPQQAVVDGPRAGGGNHFQYSSSWESKRGDIPWSWETAAFINLLTYCLRADSLLPVQQHEVTNVSSALTIFRITFLLLLLSVSHSQISMCGFLLHLRFEKRLQGARIKTAKK